ncbi:MAG: hypothetical protein K2X38_04445 [Gemmataceae bacterium]|nr:hypothetical protein [Gemmataceae bacterium]
MEALYRIKDQSPTSTKGRFWQQDGFDHLVRSQAQFDYLREYFAKNPEKAMLKDGEFVTYSKSL